MNPLISDELIDDQSYLLANLLHFGRLLRQLGISISSQQIYELAEGILFIDISRREDFYHTTRAYLLHDIEKLEQFNLAFDLFWTQQIKAMLEFFVGHRDLDRKLSQEIYEQEDQKILSHKLSSDKDELEEDQQTSYIEETKINPIYSSFEVLYRKDFRDFSENDLREARAYIKKLVLRLEKKRTRRKIRALKQTSYPDFRRSIRNNLSYGGEIIKLEWRRRKLKPRPLTVICDISGSMESYSQLFLYFLYALVQRSTRIETFVFGTRLTRLTPALRKKDIDSVLSELSKLISDWAGGTRIGESLKDFNYQWSRRVLGRGGVVIIISDGWDRGDVNLLEWEMRRLRRSVNRLIWLNPVAGSPDYKPLVRGIQAVLPWVDDFYPLNNLLSLESLAMKLGSLE